MLMGEHEILMDYRQAKSQKEQVRILADRNCVTNREMAKWLADHGEDVDGRYFTDIKSKKQGNTNTGTKARTTAAGKQETEKKETGKQEAKSQEAARQEATTLKVYIAGPITGNPSYMAMFDEAEEWLRSRGFTPVNPANNQVDPEDRKACIDTGLRQLMECSMICLLPGWTRSEGASLEFDYAETVEMPELALPMRIKNRLEGIILSHFAEKKSLKSSTASNAASHSSSETNSAARGTA